MRSSRDPIIVPVSVTAANAPSPLTARNVEKACYGSRMLRPRDIQRRFDRAAASFDDADFVHAATREGLVARLEPLRVEARRILDLGSATGSTGRMLRRRFRRAHVVSLDASRRMALQSKKKAGWLSKSSVVQADASRLPFADACFDIVVANQLLPWLPDPQQAFGEIARILKEGGVFAFATLGPDSLQALRAAWAAADTGPEGTRPEGPPAALEQHVHSFADMHDIGDGLVRAGLADPVLDVDRLSVSYDNADRLFNDLTLTGARNALADRAQGLTGRQRFGAMKRALAKANKAGRIVLELELVYGHCWGTGPASDPRDYRIPAGRIPLRGGRR